MTRAELEGADRPPRCDETVGATERALRSASLTASASWPCRRPRSAAARASRWSASCCRVRVRRTAPRMDTHPKHDIALGAVQVSGDRDRSGPAVEAPPASSVAVAGSARLKPSHQPEFEGPLTPVSRARVVRPGTLAPARRFSRGMVLAALVAIVAAGILITLLVVRPAGDPRWKAKRCRNADRHSHHPEWASSANPDPRRRATAERGHLSRRSACLRRELR